MTGNTANKTGEAIAKKCAEGMTNGNTKCMFNVASFINTSAGAEGYDFVALQEATNYNKIRENSEILKKMGYVHHKIGPSDLATFYDTSKYKILAFKVGNIESKTKDSRPYQIIFLEGILDCNYYIFVNLHNGHKNDKNLLIGQLSKDINIGTLADGKKDYIDIKNKNEDISSIINGKNFKIIVAGDFNDHGSYNYWQNFIPFEKTSFDNLKNITVLSNLPPNTCCVGQSSIRKNKGEDTMYGDYILSNLKFIKENYIPDGFDYDAEKFPTSDHLPVRAMFTVENICPNKTAQQIEEKKNSKKNLENKLKQIENLIKDKAFKDIPKNDFIKLGIPEIDHYYFARELNKRKHNKSGNQTKNFIINYFSKTPKERLENRLNDYKEKLKSIEKSSISNIQKELGQASYLLPSIKKITTQISEIIKNLTDSDKVAKLNEIEKIIDSINIESFLRTRSAGHIKTENRKPLELFRTESPVVQNNQLKEKPWANTEGPTTNFGNNKNPNPKEFQENINKKLIEGETKRKQSQSAQKASKNN